MKKRLSGVFVRVAGHEPQTTGYCGFAYR